MNLKKVYIYMYSKTSLVYKYPYNYSSNNKTKDEYYYRLRSCDTNLNSNTPANQYQKLKLIQNTVRVASSLYTMNLGSLNAYVKPTSATYNVCWNQMSDRPIPSVQKTYVPTYGSSSTRHTVTGPRPGAQSPGGVGCDIKHNSYDRYLNRLKAKGPLRRGYVPPGFGAPIPFNPAFPIYGGKTVKTNIINGCDCPIQDKKTDLLEDIRLYRDPLIQAEPSGIHAFQVGDYVYAVETGTHYYSKAIVITVLPNNEYLIEFEDGTTETQNISQLLVYFPCNCTIPSLSNDFTPYTQTALDYLKSKINLCDNTISDFIEQY
jgi:hypothetical protein